MYKRQDVPELSAMWAEYFSDYPKKVFKILVPPGQGKIKVSYQSRSTCIYYKYPVIPFKIEKVS